MCVYVYLYVCIYVYVKMYCDEKTQGFQRMILYIYIYICVCVSVCVIFNGISTLSDYLMPNLSFYKDSSGTI